MAKKLISTRWAVFSRRFVTAQRLPNGCAVALFRRRDKRRVRDDLVVKRQRVNTKTVTPVDDDDRVTALLAAAQAVLSMNVHARGYRLALLGPDGIEINGGTKLATVRAMTPTPTEEDLQQAEMRHALVEEIAGTAAWQMREAEHTTEDPDELIPLGYLKAIADRYGRGAIDEALAHLG
ncbi:MAG TPA: hypothetical protein VFA75_00370 [Nevskia sp.]|nr:hypothetical protein [Nevskia sp.]